MAKKRKSKKTAQIQKVCNLLVIILIVVAIAMIFGSAIKIDNDIYKGYQIVFGYRLEQKLGFSTISLEVFKFSFMNLLPYILLFVGLATILLQFSKSNLISSLIVVIACLGAGTLFLLQKNFIVLGDGFQKLYEFLGTNFNEQENIKLATCSIISICCSYGAAGVVIVKEVLKK